jgi:hypothetical protein
MTLYHQFSPIFNPCESQRSFVSAKDNTQRYLAESKSTFEAKPEVFLSPKVYQHYPLVI